MSKKKMAIEKMNRLGTAQVPFLFVIDYEMLEPEIIPFHEVDGNEILFDINGFHNSVLRRKKIDHLIFEKFPVDYSEFKPAYDKVIDNIGLGNTYLLNLTFETRIETNLKLKEIFLQSKAKYKLYFHNKFVVFSPETFVRIQDRKISSYPMKGTINSSVKNASEVLLHNPKEQAEHATIVDLIRNDLSLVASQVEVKKYRYLEHIKTHGESLLQTSTEIGGILPENYQSRIGDILFTLLPAGSICGAPKRKTIEIIKDAESAARGYYTGVFGYFDGHHMESAVMIRFIEKRDEQLWYKSGGGITAFSNPENEYQEMIDKVYVPVY